MKKRLVSASLALGGHFVLVAIALLTASLVLRNAMTSIWRFDVLGAVCVGGVIAATEAFSQRSDDPSSKHRLDATLALFTGVAVAVLMCGGPLTRTLTSTSSFALAAPGALLAWMGALLRARSIHVLGEAFVTDPERASDRRFVESDVYGVVRHPSELGLYAICIGMTLLCPSWITVTASLFVVALSGIRLRREERLLRAALGLSYSDYAQRVPAVFPTWPRINSQRT